jgi:hypothetical protein
VGSPSSCSACGEISGEHQSLRRTAGSLALVLAVCVGTPALGAPTRPVAARARPHVVSYREPVTISGHATRSRGVPVSLEVDRFPFASGPAEVSRQRTGRRGAYSFHQRPSHAARYRVALAHHPSEASRVVRVYVEPRVSRLRCNLCGASSHHRREHTLRFAFRLVYPADTFGTESAKPVYFYYGQRTGSAEPPKRLRLAEIVEQRELPHHRTGVVITHRVRLSRLYRFALVACTRTSERVDGLGLPGAPGSHGCGDHTISYRQSRFWLG